MEPAGECRNKVRFALSDSTGTLRFTDFDIVDAPECRDTAEALKEYVLGQPLAELDSDRIRQMTCAGNGQCMLDIAGVIEDYRSILIADRD
jgi:hypothetical protein